MLLVMVLVMEVVMVVVDIVLVLVETALVMVLMASRRNSVEKGVNHDLAHRPIYYSGTTTSVQYQCINE